MNTAGGSTFPETISMRLSEKIADAGFFFPAIAWPGNIYTRSERVE
jgi:hypothetical protein